MKTKRVYLGSWTLPSGNSCNVNLASDQALRCEWDTPPSPAWPTEDIEHYQSLTFPAIVRAVATATGKGVLGVRSLSTRMRQSRLEFSE
jgi:hypothetical protein